MSMVNCMHTKKAALHSLGCKVNAYETEAMQQLLEKAGYYCEELSDKKSRKLIFVNEEQ